MRCEGCTTPFQYSWETETWYSPVSQRFKAASQECSPHDTGTPHNSLTTPVTAELETALCYFSHLSVFADLVQSSLAPCGADYLKEEEASCILYFSFSAQELRSYAGSIIIVL